jgi:ABC-type branched-subunit amino acid transport system substrate-binding protein
MTVAGAMPDHLGPKAVALARRLGRMPSPQDGNPGEVMHAAQAMEVLLQSIARSDGNRESIRRQLLHGRFNTIAGTVEFDARGDITTPRFTAHRIDPDGTTSVPIQLDPELLARVRRDIGTY